MSEKKDKNLFEALAEILRIIDTIKKIVMESKSILNDPNQEVSIPGFSKLIMECQELNGLFVKFAKMETAGSSIKSQAKAIQYSAQKNRKNFFLIFDTMSSLIVLSKNVFHPLYDAAEEPEKIIKDFQTTINLVTNGLEKIILECEEETTKMFKSLKTIAKT